MNAQRPGLQFHCAGHHVMLVATVNDAGARAPASADSIARTCTLPVAKMKSADVLPPSLTASSMPAPKMPSADLWESSQQSSAPAWCWSRRPACPRSVRRSIGIHRCPLRPHACREKLAHVRRGQHGNARIVGVGVRGRRLRGQQIVEVEARAGSARLQSGISDQAVYLPARAAAPRSLTMSSSRPILHEGKQP